MLAVLGKLPTFRGDSRFTTWAYKFVMLEVSAKIGRHFWTRKPTVTLAESDWERIPARFGFSSEHEAEWRELVDAFRHSVEQDRPTRIVRAVLRLPAAWLPSPVRSPRPPRRLPQSGPKPTSPPWK